MTKAKSISKGKWDEIKNKLLYVKCLSIRGHSEKEIADKLDICETTLKKYKKEHPEFADALSYDRNMADSMVEAALLKLATGYTIKNKKKIKLKDIGYDSNGKKVEKEFLKPSSEEIEVAPSLAAQTFWLKNRCPQSWDEKKAVDNNKDNQENGIVILPDISDIIIDEEMAKNE